MKATFTQRDKTFDYFDVDSRSEPDVSRHVRIGLHPYCDCPYFKNKLAHLEPTISETQHHCTHIGIAKAQQKQLGLDDRLRLCVKCNEIEAEIEAFDDLGHRLLGYICPQCVADAQDNEAWRRAWHEMHNEGNEPNVSEFLASHAPTPEEKQQEAEYFAQLDGAASYAAWMEQQRLIEIEDYQGELEDDYEPEYVSNDLYSGMRRERAL